MGGCDLATPAGSHGSTVAATVNDPATLDTVSLIRPGGEHALLRQRAAPGGRAIHGWSGISVTLQLPPGPTLAPPGWYLVFAVDDHGVLSVGTWFQLT